MAKKNEKKGKGKSAPAKKAGPKKGVWNYYEIRDGKAVQKNRFSPKLGEGHYMARHSNRETCGGSGYTEFKEATKNKK
jgi:ribosomal protein S27AE